MNRRRIKRYRSQRGTSGVKFLGFVGIMLVAVVCGYMTARFVIAPLLGYDTEVLKLDFPSKLTDVFQDDDQKADSDAESDDNGESNGEAETAKAEEDEGTTAEKKNDTEESEKESGETVSKDSGYALQFGLFSTKSRAGELVEKLDKEGINAEIKEIDGQYKVISPLLDTKEEALETLKNTESKVVDDIFVTKL